MKEPCCTEVPLQVMENASFVIDLDALPHPEGANDLGKWIHIGSPKSYIAVERNKSGHILDV